MPNLGAIGRNAIFCVGRDLTVPQAPISATPEDNELRKVNIRKESSIDKVPNKFQGKSLALTEHSPSVFVTATVSNVVRF